MRQVVKLPFMDKTDLKELAYQIINKEVQDVNLIVLYPFLDRETLEEIVKKLIEEKRTNEVAASLPFVSRETIDTIQEAIKNGNLKGLREETILPFLSKDEVKKMFRDLIKFTSDDEDVKGD